MLCSKCSNPVRPIVAIDIDGTLGDYHGHFLNFADMWFGHPVATPIIADYTGEERFGDWFCEMYECDMTTFRQCKLAYRQGGLKRSMPALAGAKNLIHCLHEENVEIWICTTRPYLRLDNIDPDTRFWLERNIDPGGRIISGILYDEHKYQQLSERVEEDRVIACLDDLPDMVDQANAFFPGTGILIMNAPYNSCGWSTYVPFNLDEALDVILARQISWSKQHA